MSRLLLDFALADSDYATVPVLEATLQVVGKYCTELFLGHDPDTADLPTDWICIGSP